MTYSQYELFEQKIEQSWREMIGSPIVPDEHSFIPERIVLAKGSLDSDERRARVAYICSQFPDAVIEERHNTPHNKISTGPMDDAVARHENGKKTLVLGVLKTPVRYSAETDNTCPNYWHYSVFGFCPYGCSYCYLAGTPGVWYSPSVKVYVNLSEIISAIDCQARMIGQQVSFYHGKLQDGLALEPITGYMETLVPFFACHPYARQIILTKSATVESLLPLEHKKHTVLSWSLNPPSLAAYFDTNAPPVESRLEAMKQCAEAGYPVRAVIMPIIPVPDWQELYADFLSRLVSDIPLSRMTIGGICSYTHAMKLMIHHLGENNPISVHQCNQRIKSDGRLRYEPRIRVDMYRFLTGHVRNIRKDLPIGLCLEEDAVWREVGHGLVPGVCNCMW